MAMGMPRYEQGTHVTEVCGEKGFYFVSEISSIADLLYAFLHNCNLKLVRSNLLCKLFLLLIILILMNRSIDKV